MYIKRLEIKNFRSYKHLQLNPDKDLNFFLGANATGKTRLQESSLEQFRNKFSAMLKKAQIMGFFYLQKRFDKTFCIV